MGCASSALLNRDDDYTTTTTTKIGSTAFGHHIVSLTSTTYGLLTLDSPPSIKINSIPKSTTTASTTTMSPPIPSPSFSSSVPEIINSWELMAGLDTDSFRFTTPIPTPPKTLVPKSKSRFAPPCVDKENSNPNVTPPVSPIQKLNLPEFEHKQPSPDNGVVIYTTTLRGVRKTFEACNAVRSAIQTSGVSFRERDVSMDKGFKEELRSLLDKDNKSTTFSINLPQVFIKGKHIGGAEQVLKLHEEGGLNELLKGLPKVAIGSVCDGCGGVRFLPCFSCYGSCKMVIVTGFKCKETHVVRCPDCNENGLVLCPICC